MMQVTPNGLPNGHSFFVPLAKIDKEQKMVYGYASTAALDSAGETITIEALHAALPGYMQFANIREMHQLSAVGVTKEAEIDEKGLYIGAKVVDPMAWTKVTEGVYKGFSVGGTALSRDPHNKNIITELELIEISLVDRPCNPEAIIEMYKAAGADSGNNPNQEENKESSAMAKHQQANQAPKAPTPDEIEVKARELCKAAGENPDKLIAQSKRGFSQFKWQEFSAKAEQLLLGLPGDQEAEAARKAAAASEADAGQPAGGAADQPDPRQQLLAIVNDLPAEEVAKALAAINGDHAPEGAGADDVEKAEDIVGSYGPHSEAGYADQGIGRDGGVRLPLMKAGKLDAPRIKGAYAFLSRQAELVGKADAIYTADQIVTIADQITAAWREAITPDGPPPIPGIVKGAAAAANQEEENAVAKNEILASLGAADAKGDIKKGMYAVCSAIRLLDDLNRLKDELAAEAAREGDQSPLPSRFMSMVEMLAILTQALLEEETQEMLSNEESSVFYYGGADLIAYAAQPTKIVAKALSKATFVKSMRDLIADRTGDPLYAATASLIDQLEKAEDPQTWNGRKGGEQNDGDWDEEDKKDEQDSNDDFPAKKADAAADVEKGGKKKSDDVSEADDEKDKDKEDCDKAAKKKSDEVAEADEEDEAAEEEEEPKKKTKKAKKGDALDDKDKNPEAPEGEEDDDGEEEESDEKKGKKAKKAASGHSESGMEKALAGVLALVKNQGESLKALTEELRSSRRNPSRPVVKAVSKEDDGAPAAAEGDLAKPIMKADGTIDEEATRARVLKAIHQQPQVAYRGVTPIR